ncbi:MAG: Hint domain-containing protein, partial [Pseudomonadota bacterium]
MAKSIFTEDFESEAVNGKTSKLGEFDITDGTGKTVTTGRDGPYKVSDFFTVSNSKDELSKDYDYKGADGNFLASNDLDSVDGVKADGTRVLEATDIDISGHKNLEFSVDLAQTEWRFSPQTKITDSWEANTSFTVEVSIDGGPYKKIFAVEEGAKSGQPRLDNDLDGFGDGAAITDTFKTYKADIEGTGKSLDLRITHKNSKDKFEDIAIDNIEIKGVEGNSNAMCLTRGALVMTDQGPRAVEDLDVGDRVLTRSRGAQPIRWIGC